MISASTHAQEGPGLAASYPDDVGLESHPDVLYMLDFNDETASREWFGTRAGYGWTSDPANVRSGTGALEIQHTTGTHEPMEIHPKIDASDEVYVRWYRMWEPGYDFTQHKMPGVYAKDGATSAGEVPTGYDKYSCKLYVDFERRPRFYTYHPEQSGIYGDGLLMNLVDPSIEVEAGRWYCFEMMLKANDSPERNGELKMWIDGQLVGHYTDMRFRDTNDLKINEFTYSAYVGGTWTSERDQKLWDDQIVVARQYIGPLASDIDGGVAGQGGSAGAGSSGSGGSGVGGAEPSGGAGGSTSGGTGGSTLSGGTGGSEQSDGGPAEAVDSDDADGCACRTGRVPPCRPSSSRFSSGPLCLLAAWGDINTVVDRRSPLCSHHERQRHERAADNAGL